MLHDTIRRRSETILHDVVSVQSEFARTYIQGGVAFAMERLDNAQLLEQRRDAAKAKRLNAETQVLQDRIEATYRHVNTLLDEMENELEQAVKRQM